jgi:hypothetical protein
MVTAAGPNGKMVSKLAVDGEDKSRMEVMDQIIIVRKDKGKMWMLSKSTKTAMEMPINDEMLKDMNKARVDRSKLKQIGEETVDGYVCDKYLTTGSGPAATTWVAKENGLPIKIQAAGTVIEFKNIKVGKQPASLFEVDPGYKLTQMPDMSKMAPNMPSAAR